MKKLYRNSTVHPSPPFISDQLAFLPATVLTLAATLSDSDREVLAYLLSSSCSVGSGTFPCFRKAARCSGGGGTGDGEHPLSFNCSCFRCYMSYWIRWDSSPNRHLIHEIIDAFEDELAKAKSLKINNKREKRSKKGSSNYTNGEFNRCPIEAKSGEESCHKFGIDDDDEQKCGGADDGIERSSLRKFVSFIGERIWNVWIQ